MTKPYRAAAVLRHSETLPDVVVESVVEFFGRPRARGWIHVYSAVVAFFAGAALVSVSWAMQGTRAGLATLLYTFTIVAMFMPASSIFSSMSGESVAGPMVQTSLVLLAGRLAGVYMRTPVRVGAEEVEEAEGGG